MNAIKEICRHADMDRIFPGLSNLRFDQITPSIRAVDILAPWCISFDTAISRIARYTVSKMLPYIKERDGRWIASTHDIYGLPEHILRGYISHGDDSVLLAMFNHAAYVTSFAQNPGSGRCWPRFPNSTYATPILDFNTNFVLYVRDANATPDHVQILTGIRHLYIALHQGTDAAPYVFTSSRDSMLTNPKMYSLYCALWNLPVRHPDSTNLPSTLREDSHSSFPGQSESQLNADGTKATGQAAAVNVAIRLTSSTDQAPPHPGESLLARSPRLFYWRANVIADPSIQQYSEPISPDLNPLVSMATHRTHPSPQASRSTPDVVPAEEDISPKIAVALDANISMRSGALSTRDSRYNMVHPVPTEVSRHENEPVPSNPDINEVVPAPEGQLGD